MTKTNSLKKALAGILAACMAATTLVAVPFTFEGSRQSVDAAPMEQLEQVAAYTFDDAASIDGLEAVGATVVDDTDQGSVLQVAANSNGKNYLRLDNPFYQGEAESLTVSMNVKLLATADQWLGLFGFMSNTTGGFFGVSGNGSVHYNAYYEPNIYYDTSVNVLANDNAWHHLVLTINGNGVIDTYVDGVLAATYEGDSSVANFITEQQYLYLGVAGNFWNTNGAMYDDVIIYDGAYSAEANASYSFDDAASIEGLEAVGASVVEDADQGNVLQVAANANGKNYLRLENPAYQQNPGDVTVSMDVKLLATADQWLGLFGFMNNTTGGFFGVSGNGSVHFNAYYEPNIYYDTSVNVLSNDNAWHKLIVTVTTDGIVNTYLDGELVETYAGDAAAAQFITEQQYLYLGVAGNFWNTNGALYDNVEIYFDEGAPVEEEEPDEPMDPTQPYLLTKDEGLWQVIDGESVNTTTKSISGYITGNNFSISGWMNFNSISGNNMYLFQMQAAGNSAHGVRFSTSRDGELRTWLMNSSGIDTSWDSEQTLPVEETFLFTLNYDGDNHTISVYINNELYFTYTDETNVIPASAYSMASVVLGTSQWGDPTLDGRMADLYISNELLTTEDIATKVAAADYPDWGEVSEGVIALEAERENLQIVEGAENVVYNEEGEADSSGNQEIASVTGNAKAQLSTEKYVAETLSTNDVTTNAGYREFDTEAFLGNADDFSVTAWVRWYGDGTTTWGGKQGLNAQRFFDLFSIDEEEQGEYEFFFNGWEENYYDRNLSQTRSMDDMEQAIEELKQYSNFGVWADSANAEAAVYLCGITAGATLNGLSRPCFRPGATYAANNNQTNSGLPYQWSHIAVVYNADGHTNTETGEVYGASLTYYVDGTAYAYRYYDYADFDTEENEFYQNSSSPKDAYFIESDDNRPSNNSQIVGGSADGADIIYGLASAEALKVKNMGLDTLYLGKSTVSETFWNGEYQNAYLYNYAITSSEVGEDYIDNVKPFEGATMEEPTTATNISTNGTVYALVTEEDEVSKTTELGFNTEWLSSAYRGSSSLSFNGDGGYAEVDTSVLLNEDGTVSDNLTFSTWVNVNDTLDWGRIFDIRGNNGEIFLSNNGFFNNNSNIGLGFRSSALSSAGLETSHTDTSVGQTLTAGTWVNVTVVIKGTSVKLYFQGDLQLEGEMEMTLSQMDIHTFYLSRSCAVDGKYGLPLDPDNDILLDETYLVLDALNDAQVRQLGQYGYAGAASSAETEDNTRLEMMDVEELFDESRNVDVMYIDITDHKTLSAEVMNALADSTGKTLYVRVQQGVSYDFVWVLSSEAFASANRTFTAADEFDLLVSGTNMSSADATTLLTRWNQINPSANVTLQAQTITVYADNLPVELPLFINYNREFLNSDGTTLSDVSLNLYRGTASSYTLVKKGLDPATDLYGNVLKQDYTNPSTGASGIVNQYYVQNLTQGGSFILTPNDLP